MNAVMSWCFQFQERLRVNVKAADHATLGGYQDINLTFNLKNLVDQDIHKMIEEHISFKS
jgi:hypothetical protein